MRRSSIPAAGSPAIDAGDNTRVPADGGDLDDDRDESEVLVSDKTYGDRFVDVPNVPDTGNGTAPLVDIGAHEVQVLNLIFADGFESGDATRRSAAR